MGPIEKPKMDRELVILSDKTDENRHLALQLRDVLQQKRDYIFGATPEKSGPGEMRGATPGQLGTIKDNVNMTANILRAALDICAELDTL